MELMTILLIAVGAYILFKVVTSTIGVLFKIAIVLVILSLLGVSFTDLNPFAKDTPIDQPQEIIVVNQTEVNETIIDTPVVEPTNVSVTNTTE